MAIALANQSAGLIGTPASAWTYTTGFTPTVGRQMVVFVLTPQASGASAYCWAISGPVDNFRCVGTRSGATGSYNISAWVGTINSTSTSIGMFFGSTAVHGIIVAEFSGWTNISPIATLTSTRTFTAGTPFSGVDAPGGRDLITTGTNSLQIRSVISFNPSTISNLSPTSVGAVSDISMSGTTSTTLTSAPGGSTWFQNTSITNSATGTSLVSTVASWFNGPSGGQMAAFTMATGSLLNGQSGTWTQLTNPVGVASTLVRICYRLGTSLSNTTNTYTASASSVINAASIILGEKSLVTRTASSSDGVGVTDNPSQYQFIAQTLTYYPGSGWVYYSYPTGGDVVLYVQNLSSIVANATHLLFYDGGPSYIVGISSKVINDAGDGYKITLAGVVPGTGATQWFSAQFIDRPLLNASFGRPASDTLTFNDINGLKRNTFIQENIAYNYVSGPIEFSSNPSAVIEETQKCYGSLTPNAQHAPYLSLQTGANIFYVNSDNFDWISSGSQVILWDGGSADITGSSLIGPLEIVDGYQVTRTDGTFNGALAVLIDGVVPPGTQGMGFFQQAYLLPSTATFQDFVNVMSVVSQPIGAPDPTDNTSPPYLGGLV